MVQDIKTDNKENLNPQHSSPSPKPKVKKKYKPTGIVWFDDPHSAVKGETALWVAVITQAMMDALSRSGNPEMRYFKDEAIRWLTDNSKDFVDVCLYAGMNPDYVRRKAKKSLLSPVAWRAAPGKGKRYLERKRKRHRESTPCSPAGSTEIQAQGIGNTECLVLSGPWQIFQ